MLNNSGSSSESWREHDGLGGEKGLVLLIFDDDGKT
jgi:hypothetical protein